MCVRNKHNPGERVLSRETQSHNRKEKKKGNKKGVPVCRISFLKQWSHWCLSWTLSETGTNFENWAEGNSMDMATWLMISGPWGVCGLSPVRAILGDTRASRSGREEGGNYKHIVIRIWKRRDAPHPELRQGCYRGKDRHGDARCVSTWACRRA